MYCPSCAACDTKVVDSRLAQEGAAVKRRRRCPECGYRFTTFERIDGVALVVLKSDGRREPFDRAKVTSGIAQAAKGRPVTAEQIEAVAADIDDSLRFIGPEVSSSEIGLAVLTALAGLDQVAYLRFASVYKNFDDPDDFRRELRLLDKRRADQAPAV